VPPTTDWAGEQVAPQLGLLLLRSISESGEGLDALFHLKKSRFSALPDVLIQNRSYLGNWVYSDTADIIEDRTVNDMDDRLLPLWVVLLPCATESLLGCDEVQLAIAGVINPAQISEVRLLIGVVGGTRICSHEEADVIFGMGLMWFLALWQGFAELSCV